MKTKERIIIEALELFASHGYEAVSMRDIGSAVGIRESSIYKHYSGKRAILDAIVEEAVERINRLLKEYNVPDASSNSDTARYVNMEFEDIADMCIAMMLAQMENDFIRKFKQILTIEQYGNPEFARMRKELFMDRQIKYNEKVFGFLLQNNIIKGPSEKIIAVEFFAPFYLLQDKYSDDIETLKRELKEHVVAFLASHVREG